MKFPPLVVLLALCISSASADKVYLDDQRVLEGKVERQGRWIVVKKRLGEVRVLAEKVLRIEYAVPLEDQFRERWRVADRDDPDALRALAAWCRAHDVPRAPWLEGLARVAELRRMAGKLPTRTPAALVGLHARARAGGYTADEARFLLEQALVADPDHLRARELLGFRRYKERWLPLKEALEREARDRADAMRARGLVQSGDEWVRPEEARYKQSVANLFAVIERKERELAALKLEARQAAEQAAAQRKALEQKLKAAQALARDDATRRQRLKVLKEVLELDKRMHELVQENRRHYRKLIGWAENRAANAVRIKATEKLLQANETEFGRLVEKRGKLWAGLQ